MQCVSQREANDSSRHRAKNEPEQGSNPILSTAQAARRTPACEPLAATLGLAGVPSPMPMASRRL